VYIAKNPALWAETRGTLISPKKRCHPLDEEVEIRAYCMWALNHREIAILFWIGAFVIYKFLKESKVRSSFAGLVRIVLSAKIIIPFIMFFIYMTAGIALMSRFDLWKRSVLKDTVIWCVFTGLVLLTNAVTEAPKDPAFFKRVFVELVSVSVFVTFLYDIRTFSLPVELVLQPVLAMVVMTLAFSKTDAKHASVQSCLNYLLIILILGVLCVAIWVTFQDYDQVDVAGLLRSFVLPIALTLYALPLVYLFAVYALYEVLFIRMKFRNGRKPVPLGVRVAVLITFRLDLYAINSTCVQCLSQIARSESYKEARSIGSHYRKQ
jgi:hypothetical protein